MIWPLAFEHGWQFSDAHKLSHIHGQESPNVSAQHSLHALNCYETSGL
jgi:hypothetical protein